MRAAVVTGIAAWLAIAPSVAGADMPHATCPESVGVSSERLQALDRAMQSLVAEGRAAGVVTYVARAGRIVHIGAHGLADREAGIEMRPDTVFRMASQTKAVTSVAAMMLVEEGRLALDQPVARYLPSFGALTVAVPGLPSGSGSAERVPARRPVTVRDLLTHVAGFSYGEGALTGRFWKEIGVVGGYYADRSETMSTLVEKMATVPLDAHPGERFVYGHSTDVLGVIIETVSGLSLDAFFRTRIFEPLQLRDTHFYLPPAERQRLAAVYRHQNGRLVPADGPLPVDTQGHFVDGPRVNFAGGSGLVSTARDYGRFLQMLLNGGELEGVRLLSPKTVELMTLNHVGTRFADAVPQRQGFGFGLGFAVLLDPGQSGVYGSVGSYGFAGAYYTTYWVDPAEDMVSLLMVQLRPPSDPGLQTTFRDLVYQSIVAPARSNGVSDIDDHRYRCPAER
jgi:CubicO group peptidase (beta-lactamase class C family)